MTRLTARTAPRPLLVALALTLGLLGSALGGTLTASAADDPADGGLWYYSRPDLDTVHKTTTGKGITVAVLDGPINPAAPDLVGVTNLTTRPDSFCADASGARAPATGTTQTAEHATDMASLIVGTGVGAGGQPGTRGVAPDATVHHYAVKIEDGVKCDLGDVSGLAAGIDQAVTDHAKIISISQGYGQLTAKELDAIARAERAEVIVVAASKDRGGAELGWPASANGVVSVESANATGKLNAQAVTNPLLSVVRPGEAIRTLSWSAGWWDKYVLTNGSSEATAWTSGVLALIWSAHPNASANQIIQTLLRDTGSGKGQLARTDSWGYGPVSVKGMLAADPTTYPDVNPLLRKGADAQPAYAAVAGPATPAGTSPGATSGTTGGLQVLLIVGGGLLVLVVLAAIVLAVVLTRRKRTRTAPTPQYQPIPAAQYPPRP